MSPALTGFQTQTYNSVTLGVSQQVRLNFIMKLGGITQSVDVSVSADTVLASSSASVGNVLADSMIRDLPARVGGVLDLLSTTQGAVRQGDTKAPLTVNAAPRRM